jgi:hypothetical protein
MNRRIYGIQSREYGTRPRNYGMHCLISAPTPRIPATMTAGPFTGGQTVWFRTRVSNSHPGTVGSDPVGVVIP